VQRYFYFFFLQRYLVNIFDYFFIILYFVTEFDYFMIYFMTLCYRYTCLPQSTLSFTAKISKGFANGQQGDVTDFQSHLCIKTNYLMSLMFNFAVFAVKKYFNRSCRV